jgi:hypothetical protein
METVDMICSLGVIAGVILAAILVSILLINSSIFSHERGEDEVSEANQGYFGGNK